MEEYKLIDGVLTINDGVEIILSESFSEREDIEKIILPSSLISIGGAAFAACVNLKEVVFKDQKNLKHIDDGAFTLCSNLYSFDFNDDLETIGEMAFWETGLELVTLKNVKRIDDSAFWNCLNLKEINILNKDIELGDDVFGECEKLKKGYVACGFPSNKRYNHVDELIYSLLWLSSFDLHDNSINERAIKFINNNQELIMEKIMINNNIPAMNGLVKAKLLNDDLIERYLKEATQKGYLEISNLLIEIKRCDNKNRDFKEFEL